MSLYRLRSLVSRRPPRTLVQNYPLGPAPALTRESPTTSARPSASLDYSLSVPRLTVTRGDYTIRETQHKTTWYASSSPTYLLEPPSIPKASLGHLYVHTAANDDRQVWVYNRAGRWQKAQRRHCHPYLNGYVLNILSNGEPRWVKRASAVKYDTEAKKRRLKAQPSSSCGEYYAVYRTCNDMLSSSLASVRGIVRLGPGGCRP